MNDRSGLLPNRYQYLGKNLPNRTDTDTYLTCQSAADTTDTTISSIGKYGQVSVCIVKYGLVSVSISKYGQVSVSIGSIGKFRQDQDRYW